MIQKKNKEAQKLEEYSTLRQDGLGYSEKMLTEDIKNFIQYFKNNSDQMTNANQEMEAQIKIKAEKTKQLQLLQADRQKIASTKNKDLETLGEYNTYREFITKISSKTFQDQELKRREKARADLKTDQTSETHTQKSKTTKKKKKDDDNSDEEAIPENINELLEEGDIEYLLEDGVNLVTNVFQQIEEDCLFMIN